MKTTLLFIISMYLSCDKPVLRCDTDIVELENCSNAFIEYIGLTANDIFKEIYGEYVPADTLSGISFLINPDGRYFSINNKVITSSGFLSIIKTGNSIRFIPSRQDELLTGRMLYCDGFLANTDLDIKFCLVCKCTL